MARYIDAEQMKIEIKIAMAEQLHKDPFNTIPTQLAELLCQFADDTPTADVMEVKHGEWGCVNDDRHIYMCTGKHGCGGQFIMDEGHPVTDYDWKYCPYCGAKMDLSEIPTGCESEGEE